MCEPHAGKDDRSASISAPCEHGPAIYTQCVLIHTQTQNLISSAHPSHRMQDSGNSLGSQDSGNSHGPTSSCARAPLWGCSGNVACPRGKICFYSRLEICVFMVCLTASLFITIREPNRNIWLRPNAAAGATFPQQPHGSPTYLYVYIHSSTSTVSTRCIHIYILEEVSGFSCARAHRGGDDGTTMRLGRW